MSTVDYTGLSNGKYHAGMLYADTLTKLKAAASSDVIIIDKTYAITETLAQSPHTATIQRNPTCSGCVACINMEH